MADQSQDDLAERTTRPNREKKLAGRNKQRRYVQGTRSYLHSVTNSEAKRAQEKGRKEE